MGKSDCFCVPALFNFLVGLGVLAAAYVAFLLFGLFFRYFSRRSHCLTEVTKQMHAPMLCTFLGIGLLLAFPLLGITAHWGEVIHRILVVLLVLAVGWILARIAKGVRIHALHKANQKSSGMVNVTQITFGYRLAIVLIALLTVGALFLIFPSIRSLGVGIWGSAGIMGIAVGIAARPIFLNLMAGFQIAITKTIKVNDALFMEDDFCRVEEIRLTHVVLRTWDLRRHIIPISQFIDKSFQNWDMKSSEKVGIVMLYCDYTVPIEDLRKEFGKIVESCPYYNGNFYRLQVFDSSEQTIHIRLLQTADDPNSSSELRFYVREKMIEYLQKEHRGALPCIRNENYIAEAT
ncbi:MAG: mechanosensitive ion channel family protein [Chlamydiales bacterium]